MSTDADFLAAIAAAGLDRLPRLVYADWLDERGDVRGELIRLEEATRERVAWDEVLWQHKPRRNELRRRVNAEWLKAMGYGQTCEPLFRGQPFPSDVREAWRLIREAHERWTGEPMPDVGGHADKVVEAEKRLGLTLPPSVREYVAFAHDLPTRGQAMYRDGFSLRQVPDGNSALSLVEQAEGDLHWAVQFEQLHLPNPPVYKYNLDYEGDRPTFIPPTSHPCPTTSEFLFLYMWAYARGYGSFGTMITQPEALRVRLKEWGSHYSHVANSDAFGWADQTPTVEAFETDNVTAMLTTNGEGGEASVEVIVWRPLTQQQGLPPFLSDMVGAGGWRSGVFAR